MKKHYLQKIFEPQSVAIVGASESKDSVGAQVLRNMCENGFKGVIYPVNAKHKKVQGIKTFASISDIDHPIDLVVIAVKAKAIPKIMRECSEHGVGAAVVLSAGFAEVGKRGQFLQNDLKLICEMIDLIGLHRGRLL